MNTSPLLRLPGELRNRIYELVLHYPEGISIKVLTGEPHLCFPCNRNVLALSSTCKQTRVESSSILYEANRFIILTKPNGYRTPAIFWEKGLATWLDLIGDRARDRLFELQIDIGTSFMYDLKPSSETVWRSVSAWLKILNARHTRITMRTDVNWVSRSTRTFPITLPLNDNVLARDIVYKVLERERKELEKWASAVSMRPRELSYRRMELETCGQELRSFIALLETANAGRLD